MTDDIKYLRSLKEGVSLKDIFKEDFLNKLNEKFKENEIFPVGVAFALQNEDITTDIINLTYRDENDMSEDIIVIDSQKNPENVDLIQEIL